MFSNDISNESGDKQVLSAFAEIESRFCFITALISGVSHIKELYGSTGRVLWGLHSPHLRWWFYPLLFLGGQSWLWTLGILKPKWSDWFGFPSPHRPLIQRISGIHLVGIFKLLHLSLVNWTTSITSKNTYFDSMIFT